MGNYIPVSEGEIYCGNILFASVDSRPGIFVSVIVLGESKAEGTVHVMYLDIGTEDESFPRERLFRKV